ELVPGGRELAEPGVLPDVGPVAPGVGNLRVRDGAVSVAHLAEGVVDLVDGAELALQVVDVGCDIDAGRLVQVRPPVLHPDDVGAGAGFDGGRRLGDQVVAGDGLDGDGAAVGLAELGRLALEL